MKKEDAIDIRVALENLAMDVTAKNRNCREILFGVKKLKLDSPTDFLYKYALKALYKNKPSIFKSWKEPLSGKSIEEAIQED